jgi:phosphoesterase RecJ-like protein
VSHTDIATGRDQILSELSLGQKFLLTTHENPDGDALGSLLAMHEMLKSMAKDSVMFMSAENFPLPYEYRHMPLEEVRHKLPEDADERTIVFLDCGNIDRMPVNFLRRDDAHILNIDHHHDNTCFGTANLVVGTASCTAEILFSLAKDLDIEVTPAIAEPLYIALVTDTGQFQYTNTNPESHRMAAELMEVGVDVHRIFHQLYENVPFEKMRLLGRVLERIERYDGGRLTVSFIRRSDYEDFGGDESLSEGIVDHIRAIEGTTVAALVREQVKSDREGIRKVSLRTGDESVDVSIMARQENGGGHRQAAGFSTEKSSEDLIAWLRSEIAAQVEAPTH